MSQNLSSAAVVFGALRVNGMPDLEVSLNNYTEQYIIDMSSITSILELAAVLAVFCVSVRVSFICIAVGQGNPTRGPE